MDESFQELEAELKALKPRRVSDQLATQVGLDLGVAPARAQYTSATNLSSWKWFGWRTAAAAAAVVAVGALLVTSGIKPATEAPPQVVALPEPAPRKTAVEVPVVPDRYEPVAATNVLYDLKDEGLVRVDGENDAHRLRYRYLDTYTLKNPRSNASLTWSVPRDEIRVLPASFN